MTSRVVYRLFFEQGRVEEFVLQFEQADYTLIRSQDADLPDWARLEFGTCANCPLDPREHSYCPLAAALVGPIEQLHDVISYAPMVAEVVMPERTIVQQTTAQDAISSLIGLLNATSGCPRTAFFRPMARFHLPFSSEVETVYRAASMYLLGEYFRRPEQPDISLDGLLELYRNVELVNRGILARLRAACSEDGPLNAIMLLDLYARSLPYAVGASLDKVRTLFASYLQAKPGDMHNDC